MVKWGKAIYNRFKPELGSVDWKRLLLGKSVSDIWESFKDQLVRIQGQHISVSK